MESVPEIDFAVLRKNIGGRRSGPAAAFSFNLPRMRLTMVGEIVMSFIPSVSGGSRFGKFGMVPLSSVKTDSK